MAVIKSFSVGNGDMYYIRHGSDNFTIIDCNLSDDNADRIITELKRQSAGKNVRRYICTHPDGDHFGGIELLDAEMPIKNFYVVRNQAIKPSTSESFKHYCELRDSDKAFYISKGCTRKWMNQSDEERKGAGVQILWPDTQNKHFKEALQQAAEGKAYNNTSAVIRYAIGDTSFMWLGDLETEFMESIVDSIELEKTTVVFAAHHGRQSGRIPHSWLDKLDPQIIVIGEAPSRELHYYGGYKTITQNSAGDITFDCDGEQTHIYSSIESFKPTEFKNLGKTAFKHYVGSFTAETTYTP